MSRDDDDEVDSIRVKLVCEEDDWVMNCCLVETRQDDDEHDDT